MRSRPDGANKSRAAAMRRSEAAGSVVVPGMCVGVVVVHVLEGRVHRHLRPTTCSSRMSS